MFIVKKYKSATKCLVRNKLYGFVRRYNKTDIDIKRVKLTLETILLYT